MSAKVFEVGRGIGEGVTGLAFDAGVGAVEFNEAFGRCAGKRVEAVNVLGDEHEEFAGALEFDDCVMDGVWLRVAECFPTFEFEIPMFDARGFGSHEVLVIDGLAAGPDTLRAAEIGYPALGGDAGAGEDEDALGGFEIVG